MSSSSQFTSIYTLTTLPKPITTGGNIAVSAVSSITQNRKRKRFEIASAIDGDSVVIHNIQPPRQIASYAVSPQTQFISKPCSIYAYSKSNKAGFRWTYVAANEGVKGKSSIVCFEDKKAGSEVSGQRKLTKELKRGDNILSIEAVRTSLSASDDPTDFEVLVLRKNGDIEALSSELEQQLWFGNLLKLSGLHKLSGTLENAFLFNAKQLKTNFLQQREDVVGQLNGMAGAEDSALERITIIGAAFRQESTNTVSLAAYALRPKQRGTSEQPLQHLISWPIGDVSAHADATDSLEFSWNIKVGALHIKSTRQVATYDISGILPKLVSSIADGEQAFASHIPLSGSSIVTQTNSSFSIYNVLYSSLQDKRDVRSSLADSSKKRKRGDDADLPELVHFIDQFTKLNLIIGLHERDVVAFEVSAGHKSKRQKNQGRLVNSLGKGIRSSNRTTDIRPDQAIIDVLGEYYHSIDQQVWANTQANLQQFVEEDDADAYDRLFAQAIEYPLQEDTSTTNSVDTSVQWDWSRKHIQSSALHRQQAIFALSSVFTLKRSSQSQKDLTKTEQAQDLVIRFFPPNVYHWLVLTGHLTIPLIQQAFLQYPTQGGLHHIQKSELMAAIAQVDPSLHLLCTTVTLHPNLDVDSLVQAVKYLVRSYDTSILPAPKALLTDGDEHLPEGDNSSPDIDNALMEQVDDAMDDIEMALSNLEEKHPVRGEALSRALTQLNGHGTSTIVDSLRNSLSQHEIIFLIHLLRIELAEGGWISRYIQSNSNADLGGSFNHSITVVARLLSCAVDAIGITGWLASSAVDPVDSIDELLASLRAEISAALEGVHEATFMKGLLNDFLRYGHRLKMRKGPKPSKSIRISKTQKAILPLGLKVEDAISRTRMSGGEKIDRSIRDIGKQISMKVPSYSFEKIRV